MRYRQAGSIWQETEPEILNPQLGIPLPWWPRFTELCGGLRPHELTLFCAPTGSGKTQALAALSAQMVAMDVPHFVAPVETGDRDFLKRVVSQLANHDFNQGDIVDPAFFKAKTASAVQSISQAPLFIADYDNRVDIHEMLNMLKFQVQEHRIKLALLDNLNFFLKVTSSQLEKAEMDNAIHEFVMLAKRLPIHIILVVHPRKTEEGGRIESEFDIKGSSTAVQEASQVLLMNRPTKKQLEDGERNWTHRELVFRKIRKKGQNVGKPVWFFYKDGRLFEEGSRNENVRSNYQNSPGLRSGNDSVLRKPDPRSLGANDRDD